MAGGNKKACGRDKASIKFKWVPLDAASVDLPDIRQEGDIPKPLDSLNQSSKQSKPKTPEILSTSQLVSAIGKIWDSANRPLPVFHAKENVEYNRSFHQNEDALPLTSWKGRKTSPANFEDFHVDFECAKRYYNMVNSSFEYFDTYQKTLLFKSDSRLSNHSHFWRYVQFDNAHKLVKPWKMNGLASSGTSFVFENRASSLEANGSLHKIQSECTKPSESRSTTLLVNNVDVESTDSCTTVIESEDSSLNKTVESLQSTEKSVTSVHYHNSLKPVTYIEELASVSSSVDSEDHTGPQNQDNCSTRKGEQMLENKSMCNMEGRTLANLPTKNLCSVGMDKPTSGLQNQRHAIAGALSGTFVSLCLHPIDTIKTVIQSGGMAEKSIFDIIRSLISDRGVSGLYRGIASNIASSAPISAVYTYTYESVKGAMLPVLPKEYQSIAHCTAGGCASIATSFIFTPSERIKQQMQVSSQYQNCWAALVGILGRGGLSSLYAGWGAVLCRNIPHSIIKFYTYETLKQLLLPSTQPNARPSTCQTLICGGLAGSTAALFTTPFDVVKTRLQTQIPGSLCKYDGVFHALQEISKQEGLKGLYRGLTPRLIMYISQGALFFASYEMFKSLFAFELPEYTLPSFQDKQDIEEDSAI